MKTMKTIPFIKNTLHVFFNNKVLFSWFSFKYQWFSGMVFMVFMVFMCFVDSVLWTCMLPQRDRYAALPCNDFCLARLTRQQSGRESF